MWSLRRSARGHGIRGRPLPFDPVFEGCHLLGEIAFGDGAKEPAYPCSLGGVTPSSYTVDKVITLSAAQPTVLRFLDSMGTPRFVVFRRGA